MSEPSVESISLDPVLLREAFERAPLPMWIYDRETLRILAANEAACEQFGYRREEFLALTALDLRPGEDHAAFLATHAFFPAGRAQAGLWRHRRKDGTRLDAEVSYSDLEFDGRPARLMVIVVLAQGDAGSDGEGLFDPRLQRVLADTRQGLLVLGVGESVLHANPAARRWLDDGGGNIDAAQLSRLSGLPDGETSVELGSTPASARRLAVSAFATRWGKTPTRAFILRETAGRDAESQRAHLLQRAIEASPSGMVVCDAQQPDLPVVFVNPAFERMTGYAAWEVLGSNCRFLQGAERRQPELDVLRDALRDGESCEIVLRNFRRDGSLFWNQLTIAPLRDGQGRITHWVGVQHDLSDRRQYEAELAYAASQDPVTGLPRFAAQEDYLRELIAEAMDDDRRVALFYIDIDRFQSVNETMGHSVGDQAMRLIADRLSGQVSGLGRLSRLAGDEFVAVVAYRKGEFNPLAFAEQVRRRMESPLAVLPYSLYFTCTIGIAEFPDNAATPADLLNCAEIAMARAKRRGRNTVEAFSNEHAVELRERMALGGRLRDAIINNELVLYFQPQVNAQNGRIQSLESLVRWQTADLGLLPSTRFIRVAEELGLVVQLGRWVLGAACRQLRQWMDEGHDDIAVAVNISAQQLMRPTFVEEVREALRAAGVPARLLEIELSENAIVEHEARMQDTIAELKTMGVRLALDDFGAGYSSLSQLKRYPIDKLKIDRSFVTDVSTESGEAALARAIIALGHQLNLTVVAQGVESEAQMGFLRRNHCDQFQGFLFGEPVDAVQAGRMLRHRYLLPGVFASTRPDRTLLLVDDEENVIRSLVRLFRRDGYRVLTAGSVDEAFELLACNDVQVILSDQRMPGTSGTEFLGRVKELYPDTMRLVLSGYTDLATVTEAINRGAIYRFLTKPWKDDELREHIREAFRTHGGFRAEG